MRIKDEKKYLAICKSAIELITTTGFENTSMSKIAKKAGISASTIYVYFENKEDMINQLFLHTLEKLSSYVVRNIDISLPLKPQFYTMLHGAFEMGQKNQEYFNFFQQFDSSPLIHKMTHESARVYFQPLLIQFEKGIKAGIFKDVPPHLLLFAMFGPQTHLLKSRKFVDFEYTEELFRTSFEIAWEGITI